MRALSLCACCRHYPGAATGRRSRSSHPAVSAFPEIAVGSARTSSFSRLARRSLVAARTLAPSPICDALHRRLQPFRHLHDCSGCFRLERSPGGLAPTGKRRLLTAHANSSHSSMIRRAIESSSCRPLGMDADQDLSMLRSRCRPTGIRNPPRLAPSGRHHAQACRCRRHWVRRLGRGNRLLPREAKCWRRRSGGSA